MESKQSATTQPTRRRLVQMFLGGGLFTSIISAIYPVLRYLIPPPVADLGGDEVVAGKLADLKPNGSKIVRFGTRPALLVMTGGHYCPVKNRTESIG